ncbi:MAG: NAD-dependent epimerase/dehydratase family protein [Geodermatophilaceae bacterium]
MRTVVTGGAGFIGSAVVDALVARGDSVLAVDNLSTGSRSNLTAALAHLRLTRLAPDSVYKPGSQVLSVRRPVGPDEPLRGVALLDWLHRLVTDLVGSPVAKLTAP